MEIKKMNTGLLAKHLRTKAFDLISTNNTSKASINSVVPYPLAFRMANLSIVF